MYLQISFQNGTSVDVALSGSHTVQVIAPNNTVQEAYALNDVVDVTFHQGDPPAPEAAVAPAAEQAAPDAVAAEVAPANAAPVEEAAPSVNAADDNAAHTDAVAAAVDAISAAPAADDPAAHIAAALADVETALAQWPQSQELLDAKAQLEQIASQAA